MIIQTSTYMQQRASRHGVTRYRTKLQQAISSGDVHRNTAVRVCSLVVLVSRQAFPISKRYLIELSFEYISFGAEDPHLEVFVLRCSKREMLKCLKGREY